jgi:ATP-binding cassette subfamily F protein uup
MDEPTNDLDIETLELLEDLLIQYEGTLLLVSHDRQFMDNVVTSTLAFEGNGRVREYVGGYSDWVRQRPNQVKPEIKTSGNSNGGAGTDTTGSPDPGSPSLPVSRKKKPGYREQRELESLPGLIDNLESEQESLTGQISESGFYQQGEAAIASTLSRMEEISNQLEQLYDRWSELES